MRKIIKIKSDNKKITLNFEDGLKLVVNPNSFIKFNLYKNKEINDDELNELKFDNDIENLSIFALKRLEIKFYSPKKLKEILFKKNNNNLVVNEVLNRLKKYNLLNEDVLINDLISYCDSKHYGFNKLIKILNDKKIDKVRISKIKYDELKEEKNAIFQIKNLMKRLKNKNTYQLKKSIYSALIRYGFDENLSNCLINKFVFINHNQEINVLKLDYQKAYSRYSRICKDKDLEQKIVKFLLGKGYKLSDIMLVKEKDNEMG